MSICVALRAEAFAVRRGTRLPVTRVGMRATHPDRALAGAGPIAMLGVAGGVAPQVQVGDVVVATEVRGDGIAIACPAAPLVAGAAAPGAAPAPPRAPARATPPARRGGPAPPGAG